MIIFLNGSVNSGKTTVAKELAKRIPNTAHVEMDNIREFVRFLPLEEAIPLVLENTVSIIRNLHQRGINVVATYPLSEGNYEYLRGHLEDTGEELRVFTLSPELETVLTNRGSRELADKEVERIRYHYEAGVHKPAFGEVIDNTNQTPEETAELILGKLDVGR